MTDRLSVAFMAAVDLALARGFRNIGAAPEAIEVRVDDHWTVFITGDVHRAKTDKHPEMAPLSIYVTFNGWPAGLISPAGGAIAAGSLANEDTFIEACRTAAQGGPVRA